MPGPQMPEGTSSPLPSPGSSPSRTTSIKDCPPSTIARSRSLGTPSRLTVIATWPAALTATGPPQSDLMVPEPPGALSPLRTRCSNPSGVETTTRAGCAVLMKEPRNATSPFALIVGGEKKDGPAKTPSPSGAGSPSTRMGVMLSNCAAAGAPNEHTRRRAIAPVAPSRIPKRFIIAAKPNIRARSRGTIQAPYSPPPTPTELTAVPRRGVSGAFRARPPNGRREPRARMPRRRAARATGGVATWEGLRLSHFLGSIYR